MMSHALAYFRSRMAVLGRTEWDDPDFRTIPKTKLSSSYHLEFGEALGISNNQDNQTIEIPVTLRLTYAPVRKVTALIDTGIAYADTVITDLLSAQNRLNFSGVKNVQFNTMAVEPLADSNDNGVIIRFVFTALVIIGTR